MARLSTLTINDYSGGLNDTLNDTELDRNEASVLQNWDITKKGKLTRRDGITETGDTATGNIYGFASYIQNDGDTDLLRMDNVTLQYLNGSTWDDLDSGFTGTNDYTIVDVPNNNKVYIGNEDNTQHSWDRASTTLNSCLTDLGAAVPHGNVMIWWKNHMFVMNNVTVSGTAYPNRLYWSDLNDPDTYDTTNDFIDMPGGGRIIGCAPIADSLAIYKERSIVFLSGFGDADWRITASNTNISNEDIGVGCLAPRGIVTFENEVWFIDDEAQIRKTELTNVDAFRRGVVSEKIQGTLSGLNTTEIEKTSAWTHDNKIYFSVPDGSSNENDLVLVFDTVASKRTGDEAWTTYTGWSPDFWVSYPTSTTNDLYWADRTGKKVYKVTGDDDDGSAISARWDSKNDDMDKSEIWKRFKFGYVRGTSDSETSVGIYASVDNAAFADLGDLNLTIVGGKLGPTGTFELGPTGATAILGGNDENEFKFYYSSGGGAVRGKKLKHSIRHSELNKQPEVKEFTSHFKQRQLR